MQQHLKGSFLGLLYLFQVYMVVPARKKPLKSKKNQFR